MTRDPPKFNMQDAAWIPDEELAGKVFMIHGKRKWPGKFYGISNCKAIPTIAPKRLLPKNLSYAPGARHPAWQTWKRV